MLFPFFNPLLCGLVPLLPPHSTTPGVKLHLELSVSGVETHSHRPVHLNSTHRQGELPLRGGPCSDDESLHPSCAPRLLGVSSSSFRAVLGVPAWRADSGIVLDAHRLFCLQTGSAIHFPSCCTGNKWCIKFHLRLD